MYNVVVNDMDFPIYNPTYYQDPLFIRSWRVDPSKKTAVQFQVFVKRTSADHRHGIYA